MPHRASYSLDSTTSSLTSLSSEASVKIYKGKIKPRIDTIKNSNATLHELVDAAEKLVNEVFAPEPESTFTYKLGEVVTSVQLNEVMIAMLEFAEESGGESAKLYVAAAIASCAEDADVVGALVALGKTWLTHFLFIFKTSRGHTNQPNKTPSEAATPTIDQTATHLTEGVGNRKKMFASDVVRRDGYKCMITGAQDWTHPNPTKGVANTRLIAAHILRRAIGQFDKNHNSDSYKSAVATLDILLNFTRLPARTLEELSAELDHPSNGITLNADSHDAFDNFDWCLKKTEIENVYDVKILRDRNIIKPSRITFRDHSEDFSDSGRKLKRKASVDLPNACYIEIHAAIAGILNMSGAGKFFDELLDNYDDDEDKVSAVRCWPDLEKLMEEQLLRDTVTKSFQLDRVC